MAKRKQRQPKAEYALDIVIPVYGQADLLTRCIQALPEAANGISCRLFVVDDCGPEQEQLREVYRSLNGNSRVIRNQANSGFPKTVNNGVNAGNSPLILLLNSDCILKPGAIREMVREFDNPQVGVAGPKLLFGDNRWGQSGKVQHAGIARNVAGQLVHINLGWAADNPRVNERREMQMLTGACLMTRREVWRKITNQYHNFGDPTTGAMNEVYDKGSYEDVEYCLAARSMGYKVVYQPKAVGLHYVGASVIAANGAFPLNRNAMIFGARCGHIVEYDEWRWT